MTFFWTLLSFLLASYASAIPWDGPFHTYAPTPDQVQIAEADAPATTEAPESLAKRQDLSPQFCGWLSGLTSYAPCDPFSTCVWRTDISVVGCCRDTTNLNTCQMYTTCVNFAELGSTTSTTSDSLVLRW
jgi:hypothetical protein